VTTVASLLTALLGSSPARAEEESEDHHYGQSAIAFSRAGAIAFSQAIDTGVAWTYGARVVLRYDAWTLMDEPVVYCDLAWQWRGPRTPAVDDRVEIRGRSFTIPSEKSSQLATSRPRRSRSSSTRTLGSSSEERRVTS
jgi:hypothetical protein